MKITHMLEKEGAKWDTFNGATEWTRDGFIQAGFRDYAYRFDNGDTWDKVNGWRSRFDNIYNNLNKGVNMSPVTYQSRNIYDWEKRCWPDDYTSVSPSMRGIVHIAPPTMLLIDDYESEYLNEREQLCSRHLWQ